MEWWLRFCLGLPARDEDLQSVRQHFPELLSPGSPRANLTLLWPPLLIPPFRLEAILDDLQQWLNSVSESHEEATPSPRSPPVECPLQDACPLRASDAASSSTPIVLRCMTAGGVHKVPKGEFLDLVRKVHKGQDVKDVILTDPYVYLDVSEQGASGGGENLLEYLATLRLDKTSKFSLELNPAPIKATNKAMALLRRKVQLRFPKVEVSTFSNKHRFHDRFYLARDRNSNLRGVFGPSLNGLSARAIVLMGELEDRALSRIENLL